MAKKSKQAAKKNGSILWSLFKWTATLAVWGVIVAILVGGWFTLTLPDIDKALDATRRPTVTLLSSGGAVLAAKGDLYGVPVQVGDVPASLPQAIIATEDRRFYSHFGIDVLGLLRAAVANARAGRIVQGGSTITQQVAKNLFLTPERSYKRKLQEVLLAFWLEVYFSKDQILTIYMNRVYLGAGTYGVDAAARKYFGRGADRLSTYESALIAGLLKAPSRYNPHASAKRSLGRTRQVLKNMVAAGYLSPKQAEAAERSRTKALPPSSRRVARHFVDWVIGQVPSYVSAGDHDLTVITSLDVNLQRTAEARLSEAIKANRKSLKVSEAAALVMDNSGAVLAMVGGVNYASSQFNRTTQSARQPGSAFKPLVYLAGMDAGLTLNSVISDAPIEVAGWKPQNYKQTFEGKMPLIDAMAKSVNTIAVRVGEKAGPKRIVETARRYGIRSELKADLGLALGASEVTMLELTAAYASFSNGGYGVWPHAILEIRDGAGNVLYQRQGSGPGRIDSPEKIAAMNKMLSAVIERGTGKNARLSRPAAGKTGTTQNYRDAWFVGYTADRVGAVWVGNDDATPMKGVTGGGLPARLWREVMTAAHGGVAKRELPSQPAASITSQKPAPKKDADLWQVIKGIFGDD